MENSHPGSPQEEPQATILKIPATARDLPDESMQEMNFLDSSFFAKDPSRDLPTPAQVRALATGKCRGVRPLGIIFDESKIFVKYGREATIREAQCLWFIKRTFGDEVPVPEVYGWRVDGEEVFIYMEHIQGQTLHNAWNELDGEDKSSLRSDLCRIITRLRQLEQNSSDQFIGSLSRQHPPDNTFEFMPKTMPFSTIKDFNDWFSTLPQRFLPPSLKYIDPYRYILPDDGVIKFTHADLHRENILVSVTKPARVLALVDWEQSGWYPDYWEYSKALYTCWYEDEWRRDFIDHFLSPRVDEQQVFSEYATQLGAV
ncbi:hypothetical protein N7541_011076 [Penicillium brevicompactum]|uniref:Aminoglycoside phosphotransferase domain-containing protein n=1 Tax=Penicillium brevicompactum TaxID=5074 RepID=A0A9W9QPP6_PENBR|nr:hypothetical protein N7541_011076 [Penicillium brevicompactum]